MTEGDEGGGGGEVTWTDEELTKSRTGREKDGGETERERWYELREKVMTMQLAIFQWMLLPGNPHDPNATSLTVRRRF